VVEGLSNVVDARMSKPGHILWAILLLTSGCRSFGYAMAVKESSKQMLLLGDVSTKKCSCIVCNMVLFGSDVLEPMGVFYYCLMELRFGADFIAEFFTFSH
jgi:hypothetical protein